MASCSFRSGFAMKRILHQSDEQFGFWGLGFASWVWDLQVRLVMLLHLPPGAPVGSDASILRKH